MLLWIDAAGDGAANGGRYPGLDSNAHLDPQTNIHTNGYMDSIPYLFTAPNSHRHARSTIHTDRHAYIADRLAYGHVSTGWQL